MAEVHNAGFGFSATNVTVAGGAETAVTPPAVAGSRSDSALMMHLIFLQFDSGADWGTFAVAVRRGRQIAGTTGITFSNNELWAAAGSVEGRFFMVGDQVTRPANMDRIATLDPVIGVADGTVRQACILGLVLS